MVRVVVSYSKPTVQAPHTGQEVEAKASGGPRSADFGAERGHEHAVQVVALVLPHAGVDARRFEFDEVTVKIGTGDEGVVVALDFEPAAGQREAAFEVGHEASVSVDDRVAHDEAVGDDELERVPHLGRGEGEAALALQGASHVLGEESVAVGGLADEVGAASENRVLAANKREGAAHGAGG